MRASSSKAMAIEKVECNTKTPGIASLVPICSQAYDGTVFSEPAQPRRRRPFDNETQAASRQPPHDREDASRALAHGPTCRGVSRWRLSQSPCQMLLRGAPAHPPVGQVQRQQERQGQSRSNAPLGLTSTARTPNHPDPPPSGGILRRVRVRYPHHRGILVGARQGPDHQDRRSSP